MRNSLFNRKTKTRIISTSGYIERRILEKTGEVMAIEHTGGASVTSVFAPKLKALQVELQEEFRIYNLILGLA